MHTHTQTSCPSHSTATPVEEKGEAAAPSHPPVPHDWLSFECCALAHNRQFPAAVPSNSSQQLAG